jgi:hypothetical protein
VPASQGCSYLNRRGYDALEIIDLGATFSAKPEFSAFVIFPPIHLSPIGGGGVDGTFVGLGGGRFHGASPYFQDSAGVLLWGEETVSFGLAAADLEGLSEEELRAQATFYRTGLLGLIQGPLPTNDYWVTCPHYLHVGWFGLVLTPRYSEFADFVLGWALIDLSFDDDENERRWKVSSDPPAANPGGR